MLCMGVTVGTDSIFFNGDHLTGTYTPGIYTIEVRAYADNNFDTSAVK